MKPILQKLKADFKDTKKRPFTYQRIVDNRMTIVAWKLFKSDRTLHFALFLYRLRRDFGFTWYEVANFTGIPVQQLKDMMKRIKPILDSKVLRTLKKLDYEGNLHQWRDLPYSRGSQGYYVVKDVPAWYNDERWTTKPHFQLGTETEKEYLSGIDRANDN